MVGDAEDGGEVGEDGDVVIDKAVESSEQDVASAPACTDTGESSAADLRYHRVHKRLADTEYVASMQGSGSSSSWRLRLSR